MESNENLKNQEAPKKTPAGGLGRMPFPAYKGSEPYIFVSYAHLDSAMVFDEIRGFNENGYKVWYDEGISPGNEWTDEIAEALEKCALFVVFITPASAGSSNVQNEINFALDEKKPFLAIHLKETTLRAGIKLQIGTKQAIIRYSMSDEEYLYKYTSAFERMGIKRSDTPDKAEAKPAMPAPPDADITTVGDFRIEHGLLKEYLGKNPNVKLPDEVQIIGYSSFGEGSNLIETVDLNRTGALLNSAFSNCQNLREIIIPATVTMIQDRPFVNCPKLTLYCRRAQLPKDFEKNYGGKDIIYLD